MLSKEEKQFYIDNNVPLPTSSSHGTIEEIDRKRSEKIIHNWYKQEGNFIFCKCPIGEHASTLPSDVLLEGTDINGNPILKKINVV